MLINQAGNEQGWTLAKKHLLRLLGMISKSGTEYNRLVSAWMLAIILFYLCVSLTVDAGVHQSGYLPAAGQHGGQAAGSWGHLSRFSREAGHSDGEKPVDHPGPHGVGVPVWSHSDLWQSTLVRGPQMMAGCCIQQRMGLFFSFIEDASPLIQTWSLRVASWDRFYILMKSLYGVLSLKNWKIMSSWSLFGNIWRSAWLHRLPMSHQHHL